MLRHGTSFHVTVVIIVILTKGITYTSKLKHLVLLSLIKCRQVNYGIVSDLLVFFFITSDSHRTQHDIATYK